MPQHMKVQAMAVEIDDYLQEGLPDEIDEEEDTASISEVSEKASYESGEPSSSSNVDGSPPESKPYPNYTSAKKLIMERHRIVLDDDDPILLMVTLLDEERNLSIKNQDHFQSKLQSILDEKHYALKRLIEDFTRQIYDEAVNSNLKNTIAKLAEETKLVEALRADMKIHRMWVAFLTGVVVLTASLLFITQL